MLRLPMTHIGKKVGMALINAQFGDSVSAYFHDFVTP